MQNIIISKIIEMYFFFEYRIGFSIKKYEPILHKIDRSTITNVLANIESLPIGYIALNRVRRGQCQR